MSEARPIRREADPRLLDLVRALARDHARADLSAGQEGADRGRVAETGRTAPTKLLSKRGQHE